MEERGVSFESRKLPWSHRPLLWILLQLLVNLHLGYGQQQYFVERPMNTSVREGQTAILRCKVGQQAGRAQWTKDGFALGFDRSIPGFTRYAVLGDEANGEHNLRIEEAKLEDDAEYQCQVGPKVGSGIKPIRADAVLTVLIPPTGVEILDMPASGRLEVRENEEVVLQCLVKNAKPAAEIVWFKRGLEIKNGVREDSVTDAEARKRSDTRAKLTFRAQADDHDAEYACEARHPALVTPKRAVVTISVQYPPGPPEIMGYTEGETVRLGQEVTLICISRGGYPLAQLVWYKNDQRVDLSYTTAGRESRNTYVFTADAADNHAKFRCEASNPSSLSVLKAEVTLTVYFAPKSVSIKGVNEARIGDVLSLECVSGASNPEARLSWIVDGRTARENVSRIAQAPEGGWISSSNLTVPVKSSERNMTVSCYAVVHELGQTIVDTKVISVIYPPQKPMIYGLKEESVREGSMIRLSCIAMGGNPLASLKWFQGKKELKGEYSGSGNVASSKLEMLAKKEDNGKDIRCEASNPALESTLSETVTLRIEFPPTRVTVKVRPEKLRPGVQAALSCESSSSNPASRLSWWRQGLPITSTTNSTHAAQYGGMQAKASLIIEVTPDLDKAVYTCQATNDVLGQNVHDVITLEVLYKPTFTASEFTLDVIEGQMGSINLTARANPSQVSYVWSRNGQAIRGLMEGGSSDRFASEGAVLHVRNPRKEDAGEVRLNATNAEGSTITIVKINVQYPATIKKFRPHVMVGEGGDAFLECEAEGNPLPNNTVSWRRAGFEMAARTESSYENNKAYLTVKEVKREDIGAFECVANNNIGTESVQATWLIVKYSPVMDLSPAFQKAAGSEGQTAQLVCKASGAPNITFTWSREGVAIVSSDKYAFSTQSSDNINWEGTLTVTGLRSRDYGYYDCVARNEMGFNKSRVLLTGTSRPDTPVALKVVNVTHSAALLQWEPGFDGGYMQTFRIRYKQMGVETLKYSDVFPPNATSFLLEGLSVGTEYLFSVMSMNELGNSNYTSDVVRARTSSEVPPSATKTRDVDIRPGELPKVLIIVITMVGTALLVLNVALIACFVRRRQQKRMIKAPWESQSSAESAPSALLLGLSIAGCLLLLCNVALGAALCHRRRKRLSEASSSEGGSSKSATIEMYAPSSYNETVNGETLSSMSEKSESYSNNEEYHSEDPGKPAVSTYLIDQDQNNYSYRASSTLPRQAKNVAFERPEDTYMDSLRRNHHFGTAGDSSAYSKAGRPPSRGAALAPSADAYYHPQATDSSLTQPRYVPYPPSSFPHTSRLNNVHDTSPYTPMASLNIPNFQIHPDISSSRLPLPLPMSLQPAYHQGDHNREFSSLPPIRNLENEGHLV